MSSNFVKANSQIFAIIMIGLIIISFMITGQYSFNSQGVDSLATVGDLKVSMREFELERDRQLQFYRQFMGKNLSAQEMKQYRISENALNNLINSKVRVLMANELGVHPSPAEIKESIKEQPYFKTNDQFDLNRYKLILQQNQLTPSDYEQTMAEQISTTQMRELMKDFPLSSAYQEELKELKSRGFSYNGVHINKNSLWKYLPVSSTEITSYLKDDKNKKKIESIFKSKKASFDQPEEVKARHILLKMDGKKEADVKKAIDKLKTELTPSNFISKANQFTEDPSGKGKGGDLGWFGRGRMVKEFETVAFNLRPGNISDPIKTQFGYHVIYVEKKKNKKEAKLSEHERSLAKEEIQRSKTKARDELFEQVIAQAKTAINNENLLKKLAKKYDLQMAIKEKANAIDAFSQKLSLTEAQFDKIWNQFTPKKTFDFDIAGGKTVLVTLSKGVAPETSPQKNSSNVLARKLEEDLTKVFREQIRITRNSNLRFN